MKLRNLFGLWMLMVLILAVVALSIEYEYNVPQGTNITITNNTRRSANASITFNANAGNVTQLTIQGISVTKTWQGYYGNISGSITLENAAGSQFYGWDNLYPSGEVYASENSDINWTNGNIECYNFTKDSSTYLSLGEYEGWVTPTPYYAGLGLEEDDVDGVDETFTNASGVGHATFYTGITLFNGSTSATPCPSVRTYNATGVESAFEEVLLYSKSEALPVYAGIIEQYGARGFNGKTWNFQMLIPENGHDSNASATTTYYFYLEIE